MLSIIGSRRRLLALCGVRRAESYPVSAGQTSFCEKEEEIRTAKRCGGREGDESRVGRRDL